MNAARCATCSGVAHLRDNIMQKPGMAPIILSSQNITQHLKAACIFLLIADGDADVFGQAVGSHGTHDNSLRKRLAEHLHAVAHIHQDEIGVAGHVFQPAGFKEIHILPATAVYHLYRAGNVFGIIQSSQRTYLSKGVRIEG